MYGICAFFGHRDVKVTEELEKLLEKVARNLIESGIDEFWLCGQGNFDWISRLVMLKLKEEYRWIYLCYITPYRYSDYHMKELSKKYEVIYPYEAQNGPKKFAISRRNKYIAENADVLICYIKYHDGGAYEAVKIAQKNKKKIINLADML